MILCTFFVHDYIETTFHFRRNCFFGSKLFQGGVFVYENSITTKSMNRKNRRPKRYSEM